VLMLDTVTIDTFRHSKRLMAMEHAMASGSALITIKTRSSWENC